jgi:hypothetical protein
MSDSMQHPGTTNPNGLPIVHRPCPEWCELPTGHSWDSEELGGLIESRGHGLTIGDVEGDAGAYVSIGNLESSTVGDASTFTPVTITVDSRPSGPDLNPVQAQELADLLVLAAHRVEAASGHEATS